MILYLLPYKEEHFGSAPHEGTQWMRTSIYEEYNNTLGIVVCPGDGMCYARYQGASFISKTLEAAQAWLDDLLVKDGYYIIPESEMERFRKLEILF